MPRIARLTAAELPAIHRFCRAHIEHAMFLLSNLREAGIDDCDHPRAGPYVGCFEDGALVALACHYRMGNLILCAPRQTLAVARAALAASQRPLRALVGPEDQVALVADALGAPTGSAAQTDEPEGLYRVELSALKVPAQLRAGTGLVGRAPEPAELETLVEWRRRYHVESIGADDNPALLAKIRRELPPAIARGDVWVLAHDGQLVAKTAFNARLPDAVQIGGVWTPPALRSRGYARCAVASHLLAARAAGVRVAILFTGEHNLPAQRAYAALGFAPVGRYRVLVLREPLPPKV